MMPYLCAGSDNADGFLFYPDGCGAILKFDDYAHFKELSQYFSIYGNVEKSQQMLDFYDQEQPTVMMPVYGISIGGNAMLAVVEEARRAPEFPSARPPRLWRSIPCARTSSTAADLMTCA